MPQIDAKILPKPHSWGQEEILKHNGSIILYGGRRWGKTLIAGEKLIIAGTKDPGLYWWVGLSWKSASMKRAWKTLKKWHRQIWEAKGLSRKHIKDRYVKENEKELYFPSGVASDGSIECKFVVWFRTADNPESLQGEAPKGIVVDEAAFMSKEVWENKLEPSTIDFGAWVILMSSSNDMGWFEDFYQDVLSGKRSMWIARLYTTFDNPLIMNNPVAKAKLDEILANTPQDVIDREYFCLRRSTVAKAFDKQAVYASVQKSVYERPYRPEFQYVGFVDASGGGQNAYSLSIAHKEIQLLNHNPETGEKTFQEIYVQDVKRAVNFAHTKATTKEYAELFKAYNVGVINGDKYSGEWVINEFLSNGVVYEQSDLNKSDLFKNAIPAVNQRRVLLLDDSSSSKNNSTAAQLVAIEVKQIGDHYGYVKGDNMNDDAANVICGNIHQLDELKISIYDIQVSRITSVPDSDIHEKHISAKDVMSAIM